MNDPWYKGGLKFKCQDGCVSCCQGAGYVILEDFDLWRLGEVMEMKIDEFEKEYCMTITMEGETMTVLNKTKDDRCVFLGKHGCKIYDGRPLQCRRFPFWNGIVETKAAWDQISERCPGCNVGRKYSSSLIKQIADGDKQTH